MLTSPTDLSSSELRVASLFVEQGWLSRRSVLISNAILISLISSSSASFFEEKSSRRFLEEDFMPSAILQFISVSFMLEFRSWKLRPSCFLCLLGGSRLKSRFVSTSALLSLGDFSNKFSIIRPPFIYFWVIGLFGCNRVFI